MSKIFIECSSYHREELKPVAVNRVNMSAGITMFKMLVPMVYQSGYETLLNLAADEISFMLIFESADESFNETYQNCICSFGEEHGKNCWVYLTANKF